MSKGRPAITTFHEMLHEVCKRPGRYVGGSDFYRAAAYLRGYDMALANHCPHLKDSGLIGYNEWASRRLASTSSSSAPPATHPGSAGTSAQIAPSSSRWTRAGRLTAIVIGLVGSCGGTPTDVFSVCDEWLGDMANPLIQVDRLVRFSLCPFKAMGQAAGLANGAWPPSGKFRGLDVYRHCKNRLAAIVQRDALSPGACIVIGGKCLRGFLFSGRLGFRADRHRRSIDQAYRLTSSLKLFRSPRTLVVTHAVARYLNDVS